MAEKSESSKLLNDNRQAGHNFFLLDRFEAGMVLTGTEVKAAKGGKVQLRDAYAAVEKNEAWLYNAHISEYSHGNRENHVPVRPRKLLLHAKQIGKLAASVQREGRTLVPTRLYWNDKGIAKLEIAVATGKKAHDKREATAARDWQRDKARLMREKG